MVQLTLTCWFSFLFFTHLLSLSGVISVTFTLVNKCNYTVWPAATTTTSGGNLSTTGFVLNSGDSSTVTVPSDWSGRFWGRTLCSTDRTTGNFSCITGDCGTGKVACGGNSGSPPATLAEFGLNGANNRDFFDVSLVDGYNLPLAIIPLRGNCSSSGCRADLNAKCPSELKVTAEQAVVACRGPCAAFNLQVFCCAGNYSSPSSCEPSVYANIFKEACPQAYSYVYDDSTNTTFTCASATDYNITFCPSPSSNDTSLGSLDQGAASVGVSSSLTAGSETTRWLSPSGDFAFGFYELPNELFLLAIWYDSITNGSIVWYANGDNPAPKGSRLELNDSQGLVLTSPQGSELWRSYFRSGTVSSGLMNDAGNFQLRDKDFVVLWDSFSNPTDTLVPTQVLELNGNLSSRQGEFNFSRGRFKLRLQQDGNLVFNLINLPSNYNYEPYNSTRTADAKNQTNAGQSLIFDKSGFLYVLKNSGEKFYITYPNETVSTDGFYYKATLNYDGVLTIAYHPKDPKNGTSWVVVKTRPENICLNSRFTEGEGVCGFNSICTIKEDQRPMCTCPDGYSLIDSSNMYGGCIPNFQVICEASGKRGSQDDLYTMMELPNTDWPKSDYETLSPSTLQECKESCMQDCSCVLVSFNQSTCSKKKLPLSYGRKDQEVEGVSVMKLMKNDPLASFPNMKKDHDTLIIVISVLFGTSVFVILMLVGSICFGFPYSLKKIKRSRTKTNKGFFDKNLRNFTFKEIQEATSNFREELGRGSCGIVYKGEIGMTGVAVKKLDKLFQDSDKEFQTEMNVIGQTHHRNLVRLLGYCNEGQHRMLVYELMSNGTLASFLFTPLKPNWNQRVHIALGIARGLVYLHEECCTQIIHCDIKPQNILLDDHHNARISDFGLAKRLLINQSRTETGIRGTKGYVAPDWFRSAPVTAKV
ncbi:G-type lectin S-receptor-like serine/threonine-protein kinase RLK1 isoform X2 [Lotus japonicus]|nr:G-type lectin S-receptor-like serine/threonine-protein kinase RLK1 isoform X2 [Lotus japonicus]